jgi:hypothetical protein
MLCLAACGTLLLLNSARLLKRARIESPATMADEADDNDVAPDNPLATLPEIPRYGVLLACDKIAEAFMFLIMELPAVTQKGARELSAHKVAYAKKQASQKLRDVLAFSTQALQDLHDKIAHPSGLLNQVARHGHEPWNRHAEVQLRQLLRGVHQLLAMHSSFTAFVAEDLPTGTQLLADINPVSDVVLAQLTMISGKVNQRIQELSRPRNPAACPPRADPLPLPPQTPHVHLLQNSSSCPPVVAEAAQLPPPILQPRKGGRFAKRQTRNE